MITASQPISPEQVADHYDELDRFYRRLWGLHVHHGLWRTGNETPTEAVEQLIETVVQPLNPSPGQRICDVGCGYGETARYLVENYQLDLSGITLSPRQYEIAIQENAGKPNPTFVLGDWTNNEFSSDSFDGLISIECLAHVVDKREFFRQVHRVLRPGGRAVITAWLEGESCRDHFQRQLLEAICREGRLPSMGRAAEYADYARDAGLTIDRIEQFAPQVSKTWQICTRRVLTHLATRPDAWWFLIRRQSASWVFLFSVWRIRRAYRTGAMHYGLFVLDKN